MISDIDEALTHSQKEEYNTPSTGGGGIGAFCPRFIILYTWAYYHP